MTPEPFALDDLPAALRPVVSWLLGLREYRSIYRAVSAANRGASSSLAFEGRVLHALDITVTVRTSATEPLPKSGPLVIAANHPHGIVDGLALMWTCRRRRPDVRLLANRVLARIPELHDFCFFVDPFDGPSRTARSLHGLRAARLWLRRGGALIVFPAGEVAHGPVVDGGHLESPWKPTMERLARAAGARVVRAHIDGGNSPLFYAAGRVHPLLRTALLAREFLKKRGSTITVRLTGGSEPATSQTVPSVVSGVSRTVTQREVTQLPHDARLVQSGPFQVFCAEAAQIPGTLREIGRLREIAFRTVGEGTGRTLDVDAFDQHYRHLFLWDCDKRCVAGAYRIGQTDEIVAAYGVNGLYTRTLFRYDRQLLDRFGAPALELGRSFVAPDYQKNYNALLLLWKGIGRFVADRPRYRFLFGPVSISARYSDTSHRLLMEFLRQNHFADELAALVDAINPLSQEPAPAAATLGPQSIDEVNRLVAKAENDGQGVPVLLRQYLKLNAQVIGFNVDPTFGDALDALMVVDLTKVDRAILTRYLGRSQARTFLAYHERRPQTQAA
jgi:putative hemolysin